MFLKTPYDGIVRHPSNQYLESSNKSITNKLLLKTTKVTWMTSILFSSEASSRQVLSPRSVSLMSAPLSNKTLTMSLWPFLAATSRGVIDITSFVSMLAPLVRSKFIWKTFFKLLKNNWKKNLPFIWKLFVCVLNIDKLRK